LRSLNEYKKETPHKEWGVYSMRSLSSLN